MINEVNELNFLFISYIQILALSDFIILSFCYFILIACFKFNFFNFLTIKSLQYSMI